MAQVAPRSAQQQQANPSPPHHYQQHQQQNRKPKQHDASSSPRSLPADKLRRSSSFKASSLPSPTAHKHSKSTSPSSSASKNASGKPANGGELQATMKQRGMLHALLAEPVRFVKSNERQGQDYSAMGIVPVNGTEANGKGSAPSSMGSLILHTSSPKLNGHVNGSGISHTDAKRSAAEAGPSSLAGPPSPVKAKKQARDFYPYKVSLRFPGKVRSAATGLSNYGNTCYMNSVMQALVHTPPLAYALLTQELDALHGEWGGKPNANFDAVVALQTFAKRSLQGSRNVNAPQEFNRNLKAFAKPLRQGRQEDAHEYMRFLLEAIQQSCLARAPKAFNLDDPARQTTFVQKIFGGRLRSRVTCHNCKHNSDTFDPIMDLSLDMRKGINTLNDAFRAFVAKDKLTGSEKYRCESCKRRVDATKQFTIDKAPPALTIHLKRFTIFGGKISRQIAFEDTFNIAPYMSDRSGTARYRLYAVVHHYGGGPNSGHYVASVRSPSGKWTHMDDSHVSEMNRQGPVGDSSAYILFYLREKEEALEQAISATTATAANGSEQKMKSATGFVSQNGEASPKKRKQASQQAEETDGSDSDDNDSDDSDAAASASSMAAKLQRLSDKQRLELLRARAQSAASSFLRTSSNGQVAQKKKQRKEATSSSEDEDEEVSTRASEGDRSRSSISNAKSSKHLDGLLSSKPKSAASFYGSKQGSMNGKTGSGALDFGDEDGDELGTAITRDEYESLVGSSGSKPNGKAAKKQVSLAVPAPEDEESGDDDDDSDAGSSAPAQRVPLSKKQKRLQKKAAAAVAVAASKRSATASPYGLTHIGGGHGANNSSGSMKKNKKNGSKHSRGKLDGLGGKMASRMKPRST